MAESLLKEVLDKYKSSEDYRADIKFDENIKRYKDYYEGTSEETKKRKAAGKSAVMPPWAGTSVDHLWSRFLVSMFLKKPFYGVYPVQEDEEGILAAEIGQDLVEYQLTRPSPFNNSARYIQSALANGFAALRTGWDFEDNDVTLTNWDIKKLYYPPYTEDITKLDWVIFETWRFFDDLTGECAAFEKKYGEPLYKDLDQIPGLAGTHLEEMIAKYAQVAKKKPIHILEYWDKEKKLVIAGKKVMILETENPLDPPFIPVILCSDIPKLEGIMGTGEIEAIEDYIRQIATIINQRNDNVIQSLIPVWLQNAGIDILNEEELDDLHPGVRIQVRAPLNVPLETVLTPMRPPEVTKEAYLDVAAYERNIQDRRGSYPYVRGEAPRHGRETATGIQQLQAAGSMVAKAILLYMLRTSFVQIPSQVLAWDKKYLDTRTILAVSKTREEGIPVFRKVYNKDIQADLQFYEKVSAVDPEGYSEVVRAQLMQALQIVLPFAEKLPDIDYADLIQKVLGTFDVPGLESVVRPKAVAGPRSVMLGGRGAPGPQGLAQTLRMPPEMIGRIMGGIKGQIRGRIRGGR